MPLLPSTTGIASAGVRAASRGRQRVEDDPSLFKKALGVGASGLATAGSLLDTYTGASSVRDVLAGQNPLDQLIDPFNEEKKTSGRQLGQKWGLWGENDPNKWEASDFGSFGLEVALDPGTWMTFGGSALGRGAKIAEKAGHLKPFLNATGKGRRVAGMTHTLEDMVRTFKGQGVEGAAKLSDLADAASKSGFSSLDDAVKQVGSEPLTSLFGYGAPWKEASSLGGTGARSQKIAGALDTAGKKVAESYPGRAWRYLFDRRAGKQIGVEHQKLAGHVVDARDAAKPVGSATTRNAMRSFDSEMADYIAKNHDSINAPRGIVPDESDVWTRAMEKAKANNEVYAAEYPDFYKWKSQNPGLVSRARKLYSQGGDLDKIKDIDYVLDEIRNLEGQLWGADDNKIWELIVDKRTPKDNFSSLLDDASREIVDEVESGRWKPTEGYVNPADHGSVVSVPLRSKDGTDTVVSGLVTEAGTRRSMVLLHNPKTGELYEKSFDNAKIATTPPDPQSVDAWKALKSRKAFGDEFVGRVESGVPGGDSIDNLVSTIRTAKDVPHGKILEKGGRSGVHSIEAGNLTEHFPRTGVAGALDDATSRAGLQTSFSSMNRRDVALSDLPQDVINKIVKNPKYRDTAVAKKSAKKAKNRVSLGAKKIFEDYGEYLNPKFGVEDSAQQVMKLRAEPRPGDFVQRTINGVDQFDEPLELISISPSKTNPDQMLAKISGVRDGVPVEQLSVADDISFDTAALDAPDPKLMHAEAIAKSISDKQLADLYRTTPDREFAKYMRGVIDTNAGIDALHEYVAQSVKVLGDDVAEGTVPLSKAYEAAGLDGDKAVEWMAKLKGISAEDAAKMRVSPEVANAVSQFENLMHPKKIQGPLLDVVDTVTKWFKDNVTVGWPAFWGRNGGSGQVVNLTSGYLKPGDIPTYAREVANAFSVGKRIADELAAGGLSAKSRTLLEELVDYGVVGHSTFMDVTPDLTDVSSAAVSSFGNAVSIGPGSVVKASDRSNFGRVLGVRDGVADVVFRNPETQAEAVVKMGLGELSPAHAAPSPRVPSVRRAWKEAGADIKGEAAMRAEAGQSAGVTSKYKALSLAKQLHRTWLKSGADVNTWVEWVNRVPLYKTLRSKGYSPKAAADVVEKLHFNYGHLTGAEQQLKRLFPFYTFTRKMSALVWDTLTEKPGGALGQMIRGTRLAAGNDPGLPDYVQQTTAIPMQWGAPDDGTQRYVTGFGLAHEAPLGFLGGGVSGALAEAGSMLNPLVKTPIEWMTQESLFQRGPSGGRELTDADPTVGRTISNVGTWFGAAPREDASGRAKPFIGPWAEFLLGNSPIARALTTARQLTDTRKGIGAKATNLLTGVRVSDVSPRSRDAVLREQVQAGMVDAGARQYKAPYFKGGPQNDVQRSLNALSRILDARAKKAKRQSKP